ncbi:MAG: MFS transporter [Gaiella sp.]|nr:MFS transporter [Gaiella sp.]
MAMPLRERLGALQERDFRLLFTGTMVTTVGDRLAGIALAFAVLDIASATALGIVFAVRQGVQALVVVAGGVLSDRLPRNLVLVGASLIQAAAQAATAACVLAGVGGVVAIVALQAVYGLGLGLVIPAEVGLVPQTVSPDRLQQANALQGLTRNIVGVLGPAVGGAIVVAGSPGIALAIDAASFLVCAELLRRIRATPRETADAPGFVAELREGWQEFTSRTWLWASVVLFGIGNLAFAGWIVLGPAVADERLGGAGPWAVILTAGGAGAVVGGVVAMRLRPRRPLVACTVAAMLLSLQTLSLALGAPTAVIAAAALVGGAGVAVHLTLWFTVFQQQVPERAQSRVASYDTLGSFVLMPLGMALVGPLADAVGIVETLWIALAVMWSSWAAILALPSVWAIRRPAFAPTAVPT